MCIRDRHTGERLDIVYRRDDRYLPEALSKLNYYLRDHRTGEVHQYDPQVFDLLHDLTAAVGRPNAEINVVCGYRTPWSNEFLRRHSDGVALHSLHTVSYTHLSTTSCQYWCDPQTNPTAAP